jgi:hypothetical protein
MPFRIESCSAIDTRRRRRRDVDPGHLRAHLLDDPVDPGDQLLVEVDVARRERRADDHHLQLAVLAHQLAALGCLGLGLVQPLAQVVRRVVRLGRRLVIEPHEQRVGLELGLANLRLDCSTCALKI